MQPKDRITEGWQVWLTPRQTRIIRDALAVHRPTAEDVKHCEKLEEWFAHEAATQAEARRNQTGER